MSTSAPRALDKTLQLLNEKVSSLEAYIDVAADKEEFSELFESCRMLARRNRRTLSSSDPPLIEGGFWSKERSGTLEQCHVRIAIRPYDARGSLLVQVDLASEFWTTPDKDQQQSVTVRFLIEYAALDMFASHLEQVLSKTREVAVLPGVSK